MIIEQANDKVSDLAHRLAGLLDGNRDCDPVSGSRCGETDDGKVLVYWCSTGLVQDLLWAAKGRRAYITNTGVHIVVIFADSQEMAYDIAISTFLERSQM